MKKQDIKNIVDGYEELYKTYYYDMLEFFINKGYLINNEFGDEFDEDYEPHLVNEEFEDEEIITLYRKSQTYLIEQLELSNKLNKLLDIKDQNQELLELQKQVLNIHTKKYITVSEFTSRYNYSQTQQKGFRGRLNDPLPYLQNKKSKDGRDINGKITYDVDEVEKWLDNNMR